jgi:hypothetical protein
MNCRILYPKEQSLKPNFDLIFNSSVVDLYVAKMKQRRAIEFADFIYGVY